MQCPILQLQITDQPESFPNWPSVKFEDKYRGCVNAVMCASSLAYHGLLVSVDLVWRICIDTFTTVERYRLKRAAIRIMLHFWLVLN